MKTKWDFPFNDMFIPGCVRMLNASNEEFFCHVNAGSGTKWNREPTWNPARPELQEYYRPPSPDDDEHTNLQRTQALHQQMTTFRDRPRTEPEMETLREAHRFLSQVSSSHPISHLCRTDIWQRPYQMVHYLMHYFPTDGPPEQDRVSHVLHRLQQAVSPYPDVYPYAYHY